MAKDEVFSKINIKDYNNLLEKIIANKSFSEDTKNLLLSMLYKIETSYEDYKKIKGLTITKKEKLKDIITIINEDCNSIDIVKPAPEGEITILQDKRSIVLKTQKKVITYPNEREIYYSISRLKEEHFLVRENWSILKNALEKLLYEGYKLNSDEVIRDFDGWSWNILVDDIKNKNYNLVYQNIEMLLGDKFLEKWINNDNNINYIFEFNNKLMIKAGKSITQQIYVYICQIALLEYIKENEIDINILKLYLQETEKEFEEISQRESYLQNLSYQKKNLTNQIKKIDETVNDINLLRQEFISRNNNLKKENKIFSLSDLEDILQEERNNHLNKISLINDLMKPLNYVEKKNELEQKVALLKKLKLEEKLDDTEDNLIIELQKKVILVIRRTISLAETRGEILELIYKVRYYRNIYWKNNLQIKSVEQLKNDIKALDKQLIQAACDFKIINSLSNNENTNCNLIKKILDTRIIDLEYINYEIVKQDDTFIIKVYEENNLYDKIKIENPEELNIKLNKKHKLFV